MGPAHVGQTHFSSPSSHVKSIWVLTCFHCVSRSPTWLQVSIRVGGFPVTDISAAMFAQKSGDGDKFEAFNRFNSTGRLTCYRGRSELGPWGMPKGGSEHLFYNHAGAFVFFWNLGLDSCVTKEDNKLWIFKRTNTSAIRVSWGITTEGTQN